MSTPEPIVKDVDNTDLDAFNDLFHGKTKEAPKDDGPDGDAVDEETDDAPIEQEETQEQDEDDANLAQEDEDEDEAPKPKTRVEKRIEQLLEKARLAEERAKAAEAKLNERKEPDS